MNYIGKARLIMPMKLKHIEEDAQIESRLSKIDHNKLRQLTSDKLLPCWKCSGKFLTLEPGSHICLGD